MIPLVTSLSALLCTIIGLCAWLRAVPRVRPPSQEQPMRMIVLGWLSFVGAVLLVVATILFTTSHL